MSCDPLREVLEARLAGGTYRGLARGWALASLLPSFALWLLAGWNSGLVGYFVALAWAVPAALSLSLAAVGLSAGRRARPLETVHEAPASAWSHLETALLAIALVSSAILAAAAVSPGSVPLRALVTAGHAWAGVVTILAARYVLAVSPVGSRAS